LNPVGYRDYLVAAERSKLIEALLRANPDQLELIKYEPVPKFLERVGRENKSAKSV